MMSLVITPKLNNGTQYEPELAIFREPNHRIRAE